VDKLDFSGSIADGKFKYRYQVPLSALLPSHLLGVCISSWRESQAFSRLLISREAYLDSPQSQDARPVPEEMANPGPSPNDSTCQLYALRPKI
jgi:hypothetical protein